MPGLKVMFIKGKSHRLVDTNPTMYILEYMNL